jgi:hypothetical protein
MSSLQEGVALQAALQSLDVYVKEAKNRNVPEDQRKRAARQLRDLVATVKQGMLLSAADVSSQLLTVSCDRNDAGAVPHILQHH